MSWEYLVIPILLSLLRDTNRSDASFNRTLFGIEIVHHTQALIENVFIHLLPLTQEELNNLTLYIASVANHASAQRQYNALLPVLEERLYRLVPIHRCRLHGSYSDLDANTFVIEQIFRDPEIHLLIPDDNDTGSLVAPPPTRDLLSDKEQSDLKQHIRTAEELIHWGESERMSNSGIVKHIEDPWQTALQKISGFSNAIADAETKILSLAFDRSACEKAALGERLADIEKQIDSTRKGISKLWWHDEYRRDRREDNPFSILSSPAASDLVEKHWSCVKRSNRSMNRLVNFLQSFDIEIVYKSLRLWGSCADGLEFRRLDLDAKKTLVDGGIKPELIQELEDRIRMLYFTIAVPEYFSSRLELRDALQGGVLPKTNITTPLKTPAEISVENALSGIGQLLEAETRNWLKQTVTSLLAKSNTTNK